MGSKVWVPLAQPLGARWGHYGMWIHSGGTLTYYPTFDQNRWFSLEPPPKLGSKVSVKCCTICIKGTVSIKNQVVHYAHCCSSFGLELVYCWHTDSSIYMYAKIQWHVVCHVVQGTVKLCTCYSRIKSRVLLLEFANDFSFDLALGKSPD